MKKLASMIMLFILLLSLNSTSFAADIIENSVDDDKEVFRVDIPNEDGVFITLTGEDAQNWYDNITAKNNERVLEDKRFLELMEFENLENIDEAQMQFINPYYYKYRYIESYRNYNMERKDLERVVTDKFRNNTSVMQNYILNLSVSQTWTVSPYVGLEYQNAIKAGIGASWGKSYSKSQSLNVNVPPGKTVWVTFIPIMDRSVGRVEKYYVTGGLYKYPVVVNRQHVVTYNPKYTYVNINGRNLYSVYGVYIFNQV